MKKSRFASLVLSAVLFMSVIMPITAYGNQEEAQNEIVVISYDRALQMALSDNLSAIDINAQIFNMQTQRRDLDDQLDRGVFGQNVSDGLWNDIWGLQMQLFSTMQMQSAMEAEFMLHMQLIRDALDNLAPIDADDLEAALIAITQASAMGGFIALIEMQLAMMMGEMQAHQNINPNQNLTREARHNLSELDRQITALRLHQEQAELMVEMALRGLIVELSELDLLVEIMRAELELAEDLGRKMTLSYELGFISNHDLQLTQNSLNQGHLHLAELIRTQNTTRQNLNFLLGQPINQHTVIDFERELPELPENLARHIELLLPQTQTIRQLQLEIDSAVSARFAHTGSNNTINISQSDRQRALTTTSHNNNEIINLRTRINLQDAVDRAELELSETIRTMTAALHRSYADLEGLLAQEAILKTELYQAQTILNMAITNFDMGRVTMLDVQQARLDVFRIEQDIESIRNSIWLLAFNLENPSLLFVH